MKFKHFGITITSRNKVSYRSRRKIHSGYATYYSVQKFGLVSIWGRGSMKTDMRKEYKLQSHGNKVVMIDTSNVALLK
jgi:hypothetical protein